MNRCITYALLALALPQAARAEDHKIWRAPDAEMGAVSWTGVTLLPELRDATVHLNSGAILDTPKGFTAGLALGYDYQLDNVVVGVSGEALRTWIDGGSAAGAYTSRLPYMGALRARLGTAQGRFMLYGTGGVALARMEVEDRALRVRAAKTLAGWVGGAGVDYAWNKYLTVGIEYLHTGYGAVRFGTLPAGQDRVSAAMDPVNVRLAFRF